MIAKEELEAFWPGLTLACVRILQLYCKVFDKDWRALVRKNCKNCKCPRENHAIAEFDARARMGFSAPPDPIDVKSSEYSFVPSGVPAQQATQFYSLLPNHEVPKKGSQGEMSRNQRLVRQLPRQDLSLAACKFVEAKQKDSYRDFVTARNEIAMDVGKVQSATVASICENCTDPIPSGQYAITAEKMGDLLWHPGCFRCTTCDDLLVDLAE